MEGKLILSDKVEINGAVRDIYRPVASELPDRNADHIALTGHDIVERIMAERACRNGMRHRPDRDPDRSSGATAVRVHHPTGDQAPAADGSRRCRLRNWPIAPRRWCQVTPLITEWSNRPSMYRSAASGRGTSPRYGSLRRGQPDHGAAEVLNDTDVAIRGVSD